MPTQVTGSGLLSLVADYGSEAPKSQLVAAAGYIKPDGKLAWVSFYEALLEAKGIGPGLGHRITSKYDQDEYDQLDSEAQGLYDEIHERIGEKWDHADLMEMLSKVQDLGIESADQFSEALSFEADDPWHWQRDFVEDWLENFSNEVPDFLVIDYEATWDSTFRYDYSEIEFDGSVYVFRNSF